MAKKKDKEEINIKDIKSITFDFELSVPKEAFDDLLRKMAHPQNKEEPPKEQVNANITMAFSFKL